MYIPVHNDTMIRVYHMIHDDANPCSSSGIAALMEVLRHKHQVSAALVSLGHHLKVNLRWVETNPLVFWYLGNHRSKSRFSNFISIQT